MTGSIDRPGPEASRSDSDAETPGADSPRAGAAGLGLSRPWQQVPWVVIDVEGNGQRPPDLVEAACLPIDGGIPGQVLTWLVRPPRPITGLVRRIHGISNADVATAPTTAEVAEEIRAALAGRVVIGHHVHVDLAVLGRELDGWTPPATLDTLRLAKATWPGQPSYSLDQLTTLAQLRAAQPQSIPPAGVGGRHRAGYDTTLTAALFLALTHTVTGTHRTTSPAPTPASREWATRSPARPAAGSAVRRAQPGCCTSPAPCPPTSSTTGTGCSRERPRCGSTPAMTTALGRLLPPVASAPSGGTDVLHRGGPRFATPGATPGAVCMQSRGPQPPAGSLTPGRSDVIVRTPFEERRSMKIAVSGTHSTGKTTFLTRLRHLLETAGYHVASVADQAAAARDHGFPIMREQTATTTLWIITTGIAAELAAARRADIVLVDRPVTDALAYHLAAHTWRREPLDPARSEFLTDLARHHTPSYDLIYRTVPDPALGIRDDGHRDTDPAYRDLVDHTITTVHTGLGVDAVPLHSTDHTTAVRKAMELALRTVPRARRPA